METDNTKYEPCIICGKEVEAHYEYCCSNEDCVCNGREYNINFFCSDHCEKEF